MQSTAAELEAIRSLVRQATSLRTSENVMVSLAAERVSVILMDLLVEVAPTDYDGPWQEVDRS